MESIIVLPARELAICWRLREARLETKLSQVACSLQLEIGSSLLAAYEHGRAQIRYELGNKFCKLYNISQRWLADGLPPRHYYIWVERSMRDQIPPRTLFSTAYDRFLRPSIDKHFAEVEAVLEGATGQADIEEIQRLYAPSVRAYSRKEFLGVLMISINSLLEEIPPQLFGEYYRALIQAHTRFRDYHPEEVLPHLEALEAAESSAKEAGEKRVLTNSSDSVILPPMQSELQELLDTARRLTKPRGMKARLAKDLDVPMPRISDWMAGKYLPSGERALRLREWVGAHEAEQQKSPGGASNTTRAKTQVKPSKHEDKTQVRKRG
jgi:transcriptional regulator with XRE-family HTH domain